MIVAEIMTSKKKKKYYGLSVCVRGHRGERVMRDDRREGEYFIP